MYENEWFEFYRDCEGYVCALSDDREEQWAMRHSDLDILLEKIAPSAKKRTAQ